MADKIKEAFSKAKQDIQELKDQISLLTSQLEEINRTLKSSTQHQNNATIRQEISTDTTDKTSLEASFPSNHNISTGNRGVSTDRQTIRQTDNTHEKFVYSEKQTPPQSSPKTDQTDQIVQTLSNYQALKEDLKLKFSNLTNQEFLVYTAIYQFQEEGHKVDYNLLSAKLNLTSSSIRDYIQRLTIKGIPLEKHKENNKKIHLSIPHIIRESLSLSAIIQLKQAS